MVGKKTWITSWILHIYNLTVLVEVSYAASFIPSVTNEWNKFPTILLKEIVTKAMMTHSINIRAISAF